jgi:hypothetical protein
MRVGALALAKALRYARDSIQKGPASGPTAGKQHRPCHR